MYTHKIPRMCDRQISDESTPLLAQSMELNESGMVQGEPLIAMRHGVGLSAQDIVALVGTILASLGQTENLTLLDLVGEVDAKLGGVRMVDTADVETALRTLQGQNRLVFESITGSGSLPPMSCIHF